MLRPAEGKLPAALEELRQQLLAVRRLWGVPAGAEDDIVIHGNHLSTVLCPRSSCPAAAPRRESLLGQESVLP